MRIAILGATSQIAKDLIYSFAQSNGRELVLFARRPEAVVAWKTRVGIQQDWKVSGYEDFTPSQHFDAVMNFVGVGNPAQAAAMGASIFDITLQYDELALAYVKQRPNCRYIFLSSGAAYGSTFNEPAIEKTVALIPINQLQHHDWYAVAKLYAECRHRAYSDLPIVDLRVFNYFSQTQDIGARFLITDIVRAICGKTVLKASADCIVRDYIGAGDFYQLVNCVLLTPPYNQVYDCYSKAPIDNLTLLKEIAAQFGLQYELVSNFAGIYPTGYKEKYFSLNKKASDIGYDPTLTSLDVIKRSIESIIHR